MSRWNLVTVLALVFAVAGTAAAQSKLSADDYAEIQQLYIKYSRAIDAGDAEGYADTFTADGVFGNSTGRAALIEFAKGFHESNQGRTRPWNNEILIEPTAEGADGSCYLSLYNTGTRPQTLMVTGIYRDKLVKTSSGWRFKSRTVEVDQPADSGQ